VDWPTLVRRYVWSEERTPYLVRPERLTRVQARSELFAYGLLLATLAALVAVVAGLGGQRPGPPAARGVALYAGTVAAAAVALGATAHPAAAWYCATAPLAMALGALAGGLRPDMSGLEVFGFASLAALWLGYAARVVRIARRLHGAP
jgi:apolipoprotein N-acyltransferase